MFKTLSCIHTYLVHVCKYQESSRKQKYVYDWTTWFVHKLVSCVGVGLCTRWSMYNLIDNHVFYLIMQCLTLTDNRVEMVETIPPLS